MASTDDVSVKTTLQLYHVSGEASGLFLLHCCHAKNLDKLDSVSLKVISLSLVQGDLERGDLDETNPSGKLPLLRCGSTAVSGVTLGLQLLETMFPDKPLIPTDPLTRIETLSMLHELHEFHKLESVIASSHRRNEVPKLHGKLAFMTFRSPEEARRNQHVLHLFEEEMLTRYNTILAKQRTLAAERASLITPRRSGQGSGGEAKGADGGASEQRMSVCDMYLFWILAANFLSRDAQHDLSRHDSLTRWLNEMKQDPLISDLFARQVTSLRARFRRTTSAVVSATNLKTESPLTVAVAELKLMAAGLHLSSRNSARLDKVLGILSASQDLMAPNILNQIKEGEVKLDSDTQSFLAAEIGGNRTSPPQTAEVDAAGGEVPPSNKAPSNVPASPARRGDCAPGSAALLPDDAAVVAEMLPTLGRWDFDVLGLPDNIKPRALFFVCCCFGERNNLIEQFACMRGGDAHHDVPVVERFWAFVQQLEANYEAINPYHNAMHAADVVNSMFTLLAGSRMELTVLEQVSALIAAAAHDVGHTGHNNKFHVATMSEYAVRYSDQSVMEMHHLATAFRLLQEDRFDMFAALSGEQKRQSRHLIIDLILATDLSKHFALINKFEMVISSEEDSMENAMLMQIALKAADIGHAVKPVRLHRLWSDLISEEFFRQGDLERSMDMPVDQHMDRELACIPKSQIGFLKVLVMPLYEVCDKVLDGVSVPKQQLQETLGFWSSELAESG